MTAFEQAWALMKDMNDDPHVWVAGRLVIGGTGQPSSYECSICGAEKHGITERDVKRVGQEAIDRFGPFYDTQGHAERLGLALGDTVISDNGDSVHYTNPTKPECDPDTLHDSRLMQHRRKIEEYLNPPTVNPDDLPTILNIEYYDTPLTYRGKLKEGDVAPNVAFEAQTEHGAIKNDGRGGPTYFEATTPEGEQFKNVNENQWEELIDLFEQKDMIGDDWESFV